MKTFRAAPLAVALAIALSASPAIEAGSVAGFGGATELTQLANNAQLALSYAEEAQTALTTAKQYAHMIDQIRRNPENFAAGMLIGGIERHLANADDAARLVDSLGRLNESSRGIAQEMQRAQITMEELNRGGINLTPPQFYAAMVKLAEERGGEYERRVELYEANIRTAQQEIEVVNDIVAQADGIETEIQGLQSVVAASGAMAKLVADQNLMMMEQRREDLQRQADEADVSAAMSEMKIKRDKQLREALIQQFGVDVEAGAEPPQSP